MSLFSSSSKQRGKNKPKSKGGLLSTLGITVEQTGGEHDEERDLLKRLEVHWTYLRGQIDKAVANYYETGEFRMLELYAERPALDLLREELGNLRERGIVWSMPNRKQKAQTQVTVVSRNLNAQGIPTEFVVRERFRDFSVYQLYDGERALEEARADGDETVIEATVRVHRGSKCTLTNVTLIPEAAL